MKNQILTLKVMNIQAISYRIKKTILLKILNNYGSVILSMTTNLKLYHLKKK